MENFENIILIRYAEIHLKGLNRPYFERMLIDRIKAACRDFSVKIGREQGRIYVEGAKEHEMDELLDRLTRVFGIHSVSPAIAVDKDFDKIQEAASFMMEKSLEGRKSATFKVLARRSDKHFPMNSDMICRELGHIMLEKYPDLSVDVHTPEIKLNVEIRDRALIYTGSIPAAGGMPVGSAGRSLILLSGGIDSPVAGYMMAKRGLELSAVHFYSYPYTSERAKDKVIDLARIMSRYTGTINLYIVPFTDIQLTIHEKCPEKETTLIMRRIMMRISERIAKKEGAPALITGESLGQVASQTLQSLCVTDDAVECPVFRPLIGMDKIEIMDIAKRIGTYETSILPFEDCCTVFVPKHPTTKPDVIKLRESEALFDFEPMMQAAIEAAEFMKID